MIRRLSIMVCLCACTAQRPQTIQEPPAPPNSQATVPASPAQERPDPSIIDLTWTIVSHKKPATIKPYHDSANAETSVASVVSTEVLQPGFRVQLTSTSNYYEALQVRDSAGVHLSDEIYLDYEPPYYKVRIGNYVQREFADTMTIAARRAGFHDAWVVRTNVRVRN